MRSNVNLAFTPPLDSAAAAIVAGRILPNSDANAELFSIASLARYSAHEPNSFGLHLLVGPEITFHQGFERVADDLRILIA
jgi:hypothetical protein